MTSKNSLFQSLADHLLLNQYDEVKDFLIKNQKIMPDYQFAINYVLKYACTNNDFDLVKFTLTSTQLNIHADINHEKVIALTRAASNNHSLLVNYLLKSPEIKIHASLSLSKKNALYEAFFNMHKETILTLLDCGENLKSINKEKINEIAMFPYFKNWFLTLKDIQKERKNLYTHNQLKHNQLPQRTL